MAYQKMTPRSFRLALIASVQVPNSISHMIFFEVPYSGLSVKAPARLIAAGPPPNGHARIRST